MAVGPDPVRCRLGHWRRKRVSRALADFKSAGQAIRGLRATFATFALKLQNGLTMARMTIATRSAVGTSLIIL
jgi:hypothetical protein